MIVLHRGFVSAKSECLVCTRVDSLLNAKTYSIVFVLHCLQHHGAEVLCCFALSVIGRRLGGKNKLDGPGAVRFWPRKYLANQTMVAQDP